MREGIPNHLTRLYCNICKFLEIDLVGVQVVALRVVTLMEFVVRRSLKQQGAALVGLHKENPRKATATPTAERLLQVLCLSR